MFSQYGLILFILVASMVATIITGKLTIPAAFVGGLLGLLIFKGAGYTGVAMMATFFVLGTLATSHKANVKRRLGLAEKNKGKRTVGQVFANAGVAGMLSLLILIYPSWLILFEVMMAASFASAAADTLSSELGNVYGRSFYNILTLKKDTRGLNGVVSIEGTLIGLLGSVLIALVYVIGSRWSTVDFVIIIVGGTIGNIADSVLGATLERKGILNNNPVNFLNTLVGAVVTMGLRCVM